MTINVFGGGNSSAPVFPVQRSVRLRSSASAYFNRTFASTANTWTFSAWVKRGSLGAIQNIAGSRLSGTGAAQLNFNADDTLSFVNSLGTSVTTTAVYRDPSSWYHIVVRVTQSSASYLYVNGVQVGTWTAGAASYLFNSAWTCTLGRVGDFNGQYLDGYLTEVNFIDGQALTPTSFGSYNSSTGVWQPIKYSGTYGTNGFYLNFQDNSGATTTTIGKDSSGNGNNWTPNNISVTAGVTYDSMLDVPTLTGADNANFCTGNPLDNSTTLTNGNLAVSAGANTGVTGTIALPSSGSFYWETTVTTVAAGGNTVVGILAASQSASVRNLSVGGIRVYARSDGLIIIDSTTAQSGLTAFSNGDVIGCAYNATTNSLQFYRNNSTYGTAVTPTSGYTYVPWCASAGTSVFNWNFGQRPFTYTPPLGFKSLNTYNLPDSTIPSGATQFAATTYTGTGSSLAISNTVNGKSFQPDFVWVKGRSGATDHALYDSVRGTTIDLVSNSTAAETTQATGLTAFGSGGFTVGALAKLNTNAATYVGWQWKAGGTAVTNTAGSISSQVSANPSAGFSIVTYTGTGANATVGHGLNIAPSMVIVKIRTGTANNWVVYHKNLTSAAYCLFLDLTNAQFNTPTTFNSTAPTSTVFSVGTGGATNTSTSTYVAYCFSEIAGFSKFGSYTGNGAADGPFVYTGFRPRWLMIKRSDSTGNWLVLDTSRNTYNVTNAMLEPNLSDAEVAGVAGVNNWDMLSNGFKVRGTGALTNASGGTYIYAAFAEVPFRYALGR